MRIVKLVLENMAIFQPRKIIDPRTGKEHVVSPEEQELMLLKGAFFNFPLIENTSEDKTQDQSSHDA